MVIKEKEFLFTFCNRYSEKFFIGVFLFRKYRGKSMQIIFDENF